jgi:hypothetical protein
VARGAPPHEAGEDTMASRIRRTVAMASAVTAAAALAVGCGADGSGGGTPSRGAVAEEASAGEPTVVTAAGEIGDALEEFRALLGADNGGDPVAYDSGRREIDWDGVPDELAAPHALPGDFFNGDEAPRARGAVLETPGDHVAVSADADNPDRAAPRFGDLNPSYSDVFDTFSAERLFSPIGSNEVDLRFAVPGTDTPAAVRGFGAVYTDVDHADTAEFELFDRDDESLGRFAVPVADGGLSFLGIAFAEPVVARVHIVYGNTALGPDDGATDDVAVMDDFVYGEPQPR